MKRNLVREPAGPATFSLPTKFTLVSLPPSSVRPFVTQSLLGWQEVNISVLPAEAQDPALDNRMQEGTQKGVESSLREKLSCLETTKEVHVRMQGDPEDQRAKSEEKEHS